jgi:hypothetical protein
LGARLSRLIANGYHGREWQIQKILNVLGLLRRNIDSDLAHHLKGQRVHGYGPETGAQAFIVIIGNRP